MKRGAASQAKDPMAAFLFRTNLKVRALGHDATDCFETRRTRRLG